MSMKINIINRDTDYAIRALCQMAKSNAAVYSVSQLAKELSIPGPFLRKILQSLSKKKLLYSAKGKGGGFKLARPSGKIFLSDLLEICSSASKMGSCFLGKAICPDIKMCRLKVRLDQIKAMLFNELRKISIASLMQ